MSLAIRKRSWEEHVTQWMGLAFSPVEYNTACCHGLVVNNLQASMEKDEVLGASRKEKSASLPDCCHSGELIGFPAKLLSNISKEVDENDNHEDEEHFLEASTETLVHVSDEDDDYSNLSLGKINHHITCTEQKSKDEEKSLRGASSLTTMVPKMEINKESNVSGTIEVINELDYATISQEKMEEEEISSSTGKSLVLCNCKGLCEVLHEGVPRENISHSLNVKEITVPGKQLLHTAVIAQQRRKSDACKDGKTDKTVVQDKLYLVQSSCSPIMPMDKGLDECVLTEPQVGPEKKYLTNATPVEDIQCLHFQDDLATHEPADNQVKLRKRKEMREDRDRSQLDSMVLLFMKLDQLDQDIENALSTGSSPSSTPTYKRRHIPDLESGSESGVDVALISHSQTNLSPNTHAADLASPCLMAGSGAKPKAGDNFTHPAILASMNAVVKVLAMDCLQM